MELHDSRFARIEYIEDLQMVVHIWKIESVNLTEEDFKNEMQTLAFFFKQYKPKRVFVDQREFYFTVVPGLQRWVDTNVNKILVDNGTEKVAFVVSPDILAKLTVTQTLSESYSQNLNVRFFDDYKDAKQWIES